MSWSWLVAKIACALAFLLSASITTHIGNPNFDFPAFAVGLLANFLGFIVVDFSSRYLRGERDQERYLCALMLTLVSVNLLIFTSNLLLLVGAWTATSLSLHFLLTHYSNREAAIMAARKKFMVSRLADGFLVLALVGIYFSIGSFDINEMSIGNLAEHSNVTVIQLSSICIALAVVLRSAQLPLHGWLIQVMEAPTPVSALLHAGVVNLGGYVVIRLAPLFAISSAAQAILVAFGTITAVLAGLITLTRITIKVRLAWSTCAQMGFMLVECGLGLYDVALLHLLGHSIYKGYSFLRAGEAVTDYKRRALIDSDDIQAYSKSFVASTIWAGTLGCVLAFATSALWSSIFPSFHITAIALFFVGLAVAPLMWPERKSTFLTPTNGIIRALLYVQLYFAWHSLFFALLPEHLQQEPSTALAIIAGVGFLTLYLMQIIVITKPTEQVVTKLYRLMYFGLYLDEVFTYTAWRVWPATPSRILTTIPLFGTIFEGLIKDDA